MKYAVYFSRLESRENLLWCLISLLQMLSNQSITRRFTKAVYKDKLRKNRVFSNKKEIICLWKHEKFKLYNEIYK